MRTVHSYSNSTGNRKEYYKSDVIWLLIILGMSFILLNFIKVVYLLSDKPETMFYSAFMRNLSLTDMFAVYIQTPWTLLTYFILHMSFWHLISNAIWIWCFGTIVQDLLGRHRALPVFIVGGIAGGILYLVSGTVMGPDNNAYVGANPGVMALAAAATVLAPRYKFFSMIGGGISLWIIALIYFILSFTAINFSHPTALFLELGGAAMGWAYIALLRRGTDLSSWFFNGYARVEDYFTPKEGNSKHGKRKATLEHGGVVRRHNVTQKRIDDILDKINQTGFESLTEEEKELLYKASNSNEE